VLLSAYSARSTENARRAKDDLYGAQNSRKAREGILAGLLDPAFMARKRAEEQQLRNALQARPEFADTIPAWDQIGQAEKTITDHALPYNLLERGLAFRGDLFAIARTLVRAAAERPKPNAERLREFGEAGLESLEFQLFSEKPIYDDLEMLLLGDSLSRMACQLGSSDTLVRKILAGQSPRQRAASLVQETRLKSVALRRQLYQEGQSAIDAAPIR